MSTLKYCSQTLSNLGQVRLPDEMRPYLTKFDFILDRAGRLGLLGSVSHHILA